MIASIKTINILNTVSINEKKKKKKKKKKKTFQDEVAQMKCRSNKSVIVSSIF